MKKNTYIFLALCLILATACQHKEESDKQNVDSTAVNEDVTDEHVDTMDNSLASKGTITSAHDIPIYSMVSEVITKKLIKEGVRVSKGQVLFTLDQTMQQAEIEKTMREVEQAKFQYDNILVGQGYDTGNPQSIPLKIRNIARTRSSLNLYEQTLHQERLVSTYYTIKSPIDGVVTDVKAYQYDLADKGKVLCHVVDTEHLNVSFSILENEISKFQKGAEVHFSTLAYPQEVQTASVTQISPKVDENGMVHIKASVNLNKDLHPLMVGMTAIVRK